MVRLIRHYVASTVPAGYDDAGTHRHYVYALTSVDDVWSAMGDGVSSVTLLRTEYVDREPGEFTGMEFMTREMRAAFDHARG